MQSALALQSSSGLKPSGTTVLQTRLSRGSEYQAPHILSVRSRQSLHICSCSSGDTNLLWVVENSIKRKARMSAKLTSGNSGQESGKSNNGLHESPAPAFEDQALQEPVDSINGAAFAVEHTALASSDAETSPSVSDAETSPSVSDAETSPSVSDAEASPSVVAAESVRDALSTGPLDINSSPQEEESKAVPELEPAGISSPAVKKVVEDNGYTLFSFGSSKPENESPSKESPSLLQSFASALAPSREATAPLPFREPPAVVAELSLGREELVTEPDASHSREPEAVVAPEVSELIVVSKESSREPYTGDLTMADVVKGVGIATGALLVAPYTVKPVATLVLAPVLQLIGSAVTVYVSVTTFLPSASRAEFTKKIRELKDKILD